MSARNLTPCALIRAGNAAVYPENSRVSATLA